MKRNLALLAGLVGGAVGGVLLRRRGRGASEAASRDARADELRQKLSEARAAAAEEDDFPATDAAVETVASDQPPARPTREDAESLRRRIHERGQETADEMRRSGETDAP